MPPRWGVAVETAFFNHVFTRYYRQGIGFSYWKNRKDQEVDIIASVEGRLVPFEVKYRAQPSPVGAEISADSRRWLRSVEAAGSSTRDRLAWGHGHQWRALERCLTWPTRSGPS